MQTIRTTILGIIFTIACVLIAGCSGGTITVNGSTGIAGSPTPTIATAATSITFATNTPTSHPPATPVPPGPTATPSPTAYAGTWVNDNVNTGDVDKIAVHVTGTLIYVHGYGSCSPTYCDWGERNGVFSGAPFNILFDFGGGLTHRLTMTRDASGLAVTDVGSSSGTANLHFHQLSGADYDGTWYNANTSTGDVPQVIITHAGATMTIHGYGACAPSYCDWGTRNVTLVDDPFAVLFDFGGGLTHTLTIGLDGPKLVITDVGSHSGTNTMYFHK